MFFRAYLAVPESHRSASESSVSRVANAKLRVSGITSKAFSSHFCCTRDTTVICRGDFYDRTYRRVLSLARVQRHLNATLPHPKRCYGKKSGIVCVCVLFLKINYETKQGARARARGVALKVEHANENKVLSVSAT